MTLEEYIAIREQELRDFHIHWQQCVAEGADGYEADPPFGKEDWLEQEIAFVQFPA